MRNYQHMMSLINIRSLTAEAIRPFSNHRNFYHLPGILENPQCDSTKVTREINFPSTGHFPWKSTYKGGRTYEIPHNS